MLIKYRKIIVTLLTAFGAMLFFFVLRNIGFDRIHNVAHMLMWWQVAIIFLFPFATFLIAALRLRILLLALGERVGFLNLMKFNFAGSAVSLIAPSFDVSGQTIKAWLLTRQGVKTSCASASVTLDSFARAATNIVFFAISLGLMLVLGIHSSRVAQAFFILGVLAIFVLLLGRYIHRGGKITGLVSKFFPKDSQITLQEFDEILISFSKTKKRALAGAFLISALGYMWEVVQVGLILAFLGIQFRLITVILMYLAISIPHSLPVPAGIGFAEAGGAYASLRLGLVEAMGVSAVLLLRLRDLSTIMIGFFVLINARSSRDKAGSRGDLPVHLP